LPLELFNSCIKNSCSFIFFIIEDMKWFKLSHDITESQLNWVEHESCALMRRVKTNHQGLSSSPLGHVLWFGHSVCFTRLLYFRWSKYSSHATSSSRVRFIRSSGRWRIVHSTPSICSTTVGLDVSRCNDANASVQQLQKRSSVSCLNHHSSADPSLLAVLASIAPHKGQVLASP